jgi:hypothetical protein
MGLFPDRPPSDNVLRSGARRSASSVRRSRVRADSERHPMISRKFIGPNQVRLYRTEHPPFVLRASKSAFGQRCRAPVADNSERKTRPCSRSVCEKPGLSGWQRQAESSELADGSSRVVERTIGKPRLPLPPGVESLPILHCFRIDGTG